MSFATVGAVNSTIDLGVFSIAHLCLGLSLIAANTIAWIIAVSGSYVMNSLITFAVESGRQLHLKQYLWFATSQTAGFLANTVTVFIGSYIMPAMIAKIIALGVAFVVNFLVSYFAVFRPQS
jgi:putative flippase GtrA